MKWLGIIGSLAAGVAIADPGLIYYVEPNKQATPYIETHDEGFRIERSGAGLIIVDTPHVLNIERPHGDGVKVYSNNPNKMTADTSHASLDNTGNLIHSGKHQPANDGPRDDTEFVLRNLEAEQSLNINKRQYRRTGDSVDDLLAAGTQGYKTLKDGTRIPVTYVDEDWDEYKNTFGAGGRSKMEAGALEGDVVK